MFDLEIPHNFFGVAKSSVDLRWNCFIGSGPNCHPATIGFEPEEPPVEDDGHCLTKALESTVV